MVLDLRRHRLGACRNLGIAHFGLAHREHQRRGVPEVLHEVIGTGALRQIGDGVELQLDVVELLGDILGAIHERDVDGGDAGAGVALHLLHAHVLGNLLLHAAGDELLDLLGARAGPRDEGKRLTDRNVRVLALRHSEVAVDAPDHGADQEHPRPRGASR
jgi:hypothetical protein